MVALGVTLPFFARFPTWATRYRRVYPVTGGGATVGCTELGPWEVSQTRHMAVQQTQEVGVELTITQRLHAILL